MPSRPYAGLVLLALATVLVPATAGLAHVPEHPGEAARVEIAEPTVSRVFYTSLEAPGQERTYTFEMAAGQRLVLALNRPAGGTAVPAWSLEGPEGPIAVPTPSPPEVPEYEPFGPGALEPLAEVDRPAPATGTYTVTVSTGQAPGKVAFVVGGEEAFTLTEWARTPLDVLRTHAWEGQPWPVLLAPAALVVAIGGGLLATGRPFRPGTPSAALAAGAGLLALATAATTLVQILLAGQATGLATGMVLTIVISGLQLAVGLALLAWARRRAPTGTWRRRAWAAGLGVASVLVWAGWLIGPALALAAALWPGDAVR